MGFAKSLVDVVLFPVQVAGAIVATLITCGGTLVTCGAGAVCLTGLAVACTPCCLCADCEEIAKTIKGEYDTAVQKPKVARHTQTSFRM